MKTNQTNFLNAAIIGEILSDDNSFTHDAEKVVALAIVSLYGTEAREAIRDRALLIGKAIEAATQDLQEGAADGYPNGFLGAYLNKSLNNLL